MDYTDGLSGTNRELNSRITPRVLPISAQYAPINPYIHRISHNIPHNPPHFMTLMSSLKTFNTYFYVESSNIPTWRDPGSLENDYVYVDLEGGTPKDVDRNIGGGVHAPILAKSKVLKILTIYSAYCADA